MSSDARAWALQFSPYKGANFIIHCMVADTVNDMHGNEFWMSTERLAQKARVDRKTVTRAMAALLEDGFLTLLEERHGSTNRYRFEFPDSETVWDPRQRIPLQPDGRRRRSVKVGHHVPSPEPKVGHPVPEGGTSCPEGGSPCPTNRKEPDGTQERLMNMPTSIELSFDDWWASWPRKTGKSKAFEAYRARLNSGVSHADLTRARDTYAKANLHTKKIYLLYPSTFLHGPEGPWSLWMKGVPEDWRSERESTKPLQSQALPKHPDKPRRLTLADLKGDD